MLPWECDMGLSIYRYPDSIDILVGRDWNHGIYDFPETVGEWKNPN